MNTKAFINQVGYRTKGIKSLTLLNASENPIEFLDKNGNIVFSACPSALSEYPASGQQLRELNFSSLEIPGIYTLKQDENILRSDLKILDNPFENLLKAVLKMFYYQRASMDLEPAFAKKFARAAGHIKNPVYFHPSSTKKGVYKSDKGWYDAGDYGRYIVNSGITCYTLLALYDRFPAYFKTLKWNIPESENLPDLLAEIKYNLDWMLTMQDDDGGVFHKLTSLKFPVAKIPADDYLPLYIIGKSVTATYDFAGVMALASKVYKPFNPAFASTCLRAAQQAFAWGEAHPEALYPKNPPDVFTGMYCDNEANDERDFAATLLLSVTQKAEYKSKIPPSKTVPNWQDVGGLATYEKSFKGDYTGDEATLALLETADILEQRTQRGFGTAIAKEDFVWGSNAEAANQGIWLLHAYYKTHDKKYFNAAVKTLDYLLGKNPLDMSFVTAFGTKTPQHPHHRPSISDYIDEPIPGMLVGGPQNNFNADVIRKRCKDYTTPYPATSYLDHALSFAVNEVAINWNAPLAYLTGAIDALQSEF